VPDIADLWNFPPDRRCAKRAELSGVIMAFCGG